MASSSEEEMTPKKEPRKRARAKRASVSQRESAPRKAATSITKSATERRVSAPKSEIVEPKPDDSRKAPTPLAASRKSRSLKQKRLVVVVVVMAIGVGSSAAIGFTDVGRIDVRQTIEARNERIRTNTTDDRDVLASTLEVPVQDTKNMNKADGGLKGRGIVEAPPIPEPETATSTASSSDPTASSTTKMASSTEEISSGEETGGEESEDENDNDVPGA